MSIESAYRRAMRAARVQAFVTLRCDVRPLLLGGVPRLIFTSGQLLEPRADGLPADPHAGAVVQVVSQFAAEGLAATSSPRIDAVQEPSTERRRPDQPRQQQGPGQ